MESPEAQCLFNMPPLAFLTTSVTSAQCFRKVGKVNPLQVENIAQRKVLTILSFAVQEFNFKGAFNIGKHLGFFTFSLALWIPGKLVHCFKSDLQPLPKGWLTFHSGGESHVLGTHPESTLAI